MSGKLKQGKHLVCFLSHVGNRGLLLFFAENWTEAVLVCFHLSFYFGIIIDSHATVRNNRVFMHPYPMVTSCRIGVLILTSITVKIGLLQSGSLMVCSYTPTHSAPVRGTLTCGKSQKLLHF